MTPRRDMTPRQFELALANQQFARMTYRRSVYFKSTKAGTDKSMKYFTIRYSRLSRRMAIKDLIQSRAFHEKKLRLADPYSLKDF